MNRDAVLPLGFLVTLGFLPRWLLMIGTDVMATDGVGYLEAAFSGEDGGAATRLPLYPALIRGAALVFRDPQTSAQVVSLICGALFPAVVYLAARRAHPPSALVAGLLAAALPYHLRYSADVLTEPLYMVFLGLVVWGLSGDSVAWRDAILVGAAAGLVGLTRPEGNLVAAVAIVALVVRARKRPAVVASGVLVVGLVLSVHLFRFDRTSDTAGLLRANYVFHLLELETEKPVAWADIEAFDLASVGPGRIVRKTLLGFGESIGMLAEALHPLTFLLGLVGLAAAWKLGVPGLGRRMGFAAMVSLFLFVFFAVLHPSRRLLLQCVLPALFLAGFAWHWMRQTLGPKPAAVAIAIVWLAGVGKAGFTQREDKLWIREAGERIERLAAPRKPIVLTSSPRLAYYAGATRIDPADVLGQDGRVSEALVADRLRGLDVRPRFLVLLPGEERSHVAPPDPAWICLRAGPDGLRPWSE